jgi:glutamate/tyrosine decarboxylase-like PLP-dependent enzyme
MKPIKRPSNLSGIRASMFTQRQEHTLFEQAKDFAFRYLDELNERPVYPSKEAIAALKVFDEPLPQGPQSASDILQLLHTHGSPGTVTQTGGRYFGFVCGSATPVAIAAKWLSDVWDQNPALFVLSPILSKLETVCQTWLVDLFRLPEETVAGFVSGTSTATICGLAAGRNALLKGMGWNVNEQGMNGAPKLRIVLGEQAHGTVFKALALLGFGVGDLERVPIDANGDIDQDQLPVLDDRCLVILQAGNVNSGGFDPIDAICDRANGAGAWVHIDGAFGLWAAGSKKTRHLTNGIEKADSWSVDAHKTLNVPYDCGIVLCRHAEDLILALQLSGDYIQYSDKRDNMMYTPEMSRRSRAVELWATLKYFGKSGIEELVDGLCERAFQFEELLTKKGFHILNKVVFNQVLVACDTARETEATLKHIQASGECWCGGSSWHGKPVIRISVCSWATTASDVEHSVATFIKCRTLAQSEMSIDPHSDN